MWEYALADHWENLKSAIVPHDQNFRALVHVHGALAVYLALALLSRRGLSAFWPVGVVCVLTFANETLDLFHLPTIHQAWVLRDTGWDIVNSLVWPIAITLTARWLPLRERQGSSTSEDC